MNEPGEEFAVYSHASQRDQGLPPDPDRSNNSRSELAFYAMREFAQQSRSNPEFVLRDLMVDMMHWCDRHGSQFADELQLALQTYQQEITPLHQESIEGVEPELHSGDENMGLIGEALKPTDPTHEIKMPF